MPLTSHGLYFLEVGTGKLEGWRLNEEGRAGYSVSDDNRWIQAWTSDNTYLVDRQEGRVWRMEASLRAASSRWVVVRGRREFIVLATDLKEVARFTIPTDAFDFTLYIAPTEDRLFVMPTRGADEVSLYRVDLPGGQVSEVGGLPAVTDLKSIWSAWFRSSEEGNELLVGIFGSRTHGSDSRSYLVRLTWDGQLLDHLMVKGGYPALSPTGELLSVTQDLGSTPGAILVTDRAGTPRFRIRGLPGQDWLAGSSDLLVNMPGGCQRLTPEGKATRLPVCTEIPPDSWIDAAPDDPNLLAAGPLHVLSLDGQIHYRLAVSESLNWEDGYVRAWGSRSQEYRLWLRDPPPRDGAYSYPWELPVEIEFPPFDDRLVVQGTGDCLNLRRDPDMTSEIITCLPDGTILEPLGPDGPAEGRWGRVQTGQGQTGWVSLSEGYVGWYH